MIEYKFGDMVDHPEYGRCIFVAYNDLKKSSASVVDTGNDWTKHVNVSDLTPADPRIIKIGGVWHRVYTSLDTEEAREREGGFVLFSRHAASDYDQSGLLGSIETTADSDRPYYGANSEWQYIALPIETTETEPEKKPTADQVCEYIAAHPDIIRDAVRKAMEEEVQGMTSEVMP